MFAFAFKTLFADRGKLSMALVGVAFSLVLVSIQGGLFFGLMRKASLLVDNSDADIWVGHRRVELVDLPKSIPEIWLNRIRGLRDVKAAEACVIGNGFMTLPNGGYENVWVIGVDPSASIGGGWAFVQGDRAELLRPDAISFDRLDLRRLGNPGVGDVVEINGKRARFVAMTEGISPFTTTPYLFTNLETARRYTQTPAGRCSYVLVKARDGANTAQLVEQIRRRVPEADVQTSREFSDRSRAYWMQRTGIGISFGAATLLGVLVGLTMIAQSLYALALDHLPDYATLKAIGAEEKQVGMVVVTQALIVALLGSTIGIALVLLIQRGFSSPMAPIEIPLRLLCSAVVLVFGICLLATILPVRRIQRLDPAIVLQG